jgi:hypothetical protein
MPMKSGILSTDVKENEFKIKILKEKNNKHTNKLVQQHTLYRTNITPPPLFRP